MNLLQTALLKGRGIIFFSQDEITEMLQACEQCNIKWSDGKKATKFFPEPFPIYICLREGRLRYGNLRYPQQFCTGLVQWHRLKTQ